MPRYETAEKHLINNTRKKWPGPIKHKTHVVINSFWRVIATAALAQRRVLPPLRYRRICTCLFHLIWSKHRTRTGVMRRKENAAAPSTPALGGVITIVFLIVASTVTSSQTKSRIIRKTPRRHNSTLRIVVDQTFSQGT